MISVSNLNLIFTRGTPVGSSREREGEGASQLKGRGRDSREGGRGRDREGLRSESQEALITKEREGEPCREGEVTVVIHCHERMARYHLTSP